MKILIVAAALALKLSSAVACAAQQFPSAVCRGWLHTPGARPVSDIRYSVPPPALYPAAVLMESAPVPHPLDLKGYLAQLNLWSAATESLKAHPEQAAALGKRLPPSWPVTVRDQHFSIPTEWLRKTLDSLQSHPSFANDYSREIQARISAMREEARAFELEPATRPEMARNKLSEILSRREFAGLHGPAWWDRLRDRLGYFAKRALSRIVGRLGNHPLAYQRLTWTVAIALILAAMFGLFRTFLRRRPAAGLDLHGPIRIPRNWRYWAGEASAASAREDYREAIHLAYRSAVYRLEELGIWQIDGARTPREYVRLLRVSAEHAGTPEASNVRPAESLRDTFTAITSRFERVWYGGRPASKGDFQSVMMQLEALGCALQSTPATGNS